jgi:chemotaxis protein MotA
MDPLTLIGIGSALFMLFVGIMMEGTPISALIGIPAFLIVVVPTVLVAVAGLTRGDIPVITASVKRALTGGVGETTGSIALVVRFAEHARREGLLSLEGEARTIEDPFLRKGINLAIDGTDPEELRAILDAEIGARRSQQRVAAKFFTDMAGFAPTLGIVGAVVGLIGVLGNLADPAEAGTGISVAFIATFYGVGIANLVFMPMANKLKRIAEADAAHMELLLEGIVAIQAGSNPRVIEEKLVAFLPAAERAARDKEGREGRAA